MLQAIFADEETLKKLTNYGLASGVVFFVAAAIVYDRMVDADNPAEWLLPLVGLLAFLAVVVVVVSSWSRLEHRRQASDTLLALAKQVNADSVEELEALIAVEALKGAFMVGADVTVTTTPGTTEEAADELETELLLALQEHSGLPNRYGRAAFHEATSPILRRTAQQSTAPAQTVTTVRLRRL